MNSSSRGIGDVPSSSLRSDPRDTHFAGRHIRGPWLVRGMAVDSADGRGVAICFPRLDFPEAERRPYETAKLLAAAPVIDDLYQSEINFSISCFWDGGLDVALGDQMNGYREQAVVRTFLEAAMWLRDAAIRHYPNSEFAARYADGSEATKTGADDASGMNP